MPTFALDNLDQALQELPSLSVIVVQALDLLAQEDVSMGKVMACVSRDQSLVGRILKVANSPFYGMSTNIASLKDAATILGIHSLYHIIASSAVIAHFPDDTETALSPLEFWQHSINVGVCAQVLSRKCNVDSELAFTTGLLHDVGRLVTAVHYSEQYNEIQRYVEQQGCSLTDAEKAVLGLDHTKIGAAIIRQWHLPETIAISIENHHAPAQQPELRLASLVHLADVISHGLGVDSCACGAPMPRLDPLVLQWLGLSWDNLRDSLPEIDDLNESASELIA